MIAKTCDLQNLLPESREVGDNSTAPCFNSTHAGKRSFLSGPLIDDCLVMANAKGRGMA